MIKVAIKHKIWEYAIHLLFNHIAINFKEESKRIYAKDLTSKYLGMQLSKYSDGVLVFSVGDKMVPSFYIEEYNHNNIVTSIILVSSKYAIAPKSNISNMSAYTYYVAITNTNGNTTITDYSPIYNNSWIVFK